MQVIATGKWSKTLKQWSMVVAIRRPTKSDTKRVQSDRRPAK